jgi:DNA-binding transcriptional LysR family regulator
LAGLGNLMKHLRILSYVDEVARSGSIRKAAEQLHVTASAVNRRIADLEAELGAPLFERLPRGVRLTAAGELFVHYLRRQTGDAERLRSQIEDLKGLRRGTVRIACSQALAFDFLPRAIAEFRRTYPLVEFAVKVVDHEYAMAALVAYDVDLVLVFRPPLLPNFQPLMTLEQQLVAIMPKEHPLAAKRKLRLHDCAAYPLALPERAIGGRQLLDEVTARTGLRFNVVAESNSFELLRGLVGHAGLISFQIRIGTVAERSKLSLVAREIDERDLAKANLVFGRLRDRNLPIATAIFAERIIAKLEAMAESGRGKASPDRKASKQRER